jgi:hypothetical protein
MAKRIDEIELGKRDERYDVVCPKCHAAVGSPCYEKKLDGCDRVTYVHPERMQDVIASSSR